MINQNFVILGVIMTVANIGFPLYIIFITLVIFSLVQFQLGKQIRFMWNIAA